MIITLWEGNHAFQKAIDTEFGLQGFEELNKQQGSDELIEEVYIFRRVQSGCILYALVINDCGDTIQ